jgi:hypothetical protein
MAHGRRLGNGTDDSAQAGTIHLTLWLLGSV